ncbi:membrane protein [Actinotalea ferrariae CF5-4]|uniref:Membrane protein n=1 Tax=Actinotalea ferrariae CF5-4 TaxID=948458 RepID=A0A021VVU8_9CELL|nr:membrane protein [Actinotalea ferrariae CF5-4]
MTTPATPAVPVPGQRRADVSLTFARVLRSEWIKAVTLRSTWIMLASIVVLTAGFGVVAALTASGATDGSGPGFGGEGRDPLSIVFTGTHPALLLVGVAGALVGAREYASGLIRSTLAAVPARLPVLAAKILVFSALTGVVVLASTLVVFFAGMAVLGDAGATTVGWSDDGVARAVLGTAAYLTGLGITGVALGVLLRSIGGSIAALIGGVVFLPTLATMVLPESWDGVLKFLPSNAANSFTTFTPDASGAFLDATTGAVVFTTWVLAAVIGAAVSLRTRDA